MVNSQIQKERPLLIWYPSIGYYASFYLSNVIQVIQNDQSHKNQINQSHEMAISYKVAK